jgi:hypothetical protein
VPSAPPVVGLLPPVAGIVVAEPIEPPLPVVPPIAMFPAALRLTPAAFVPPPAEAFAVLDVAPVFLSLGVPKHVIVAKLCSHHPNSTCGPRVNLGLTRI